METIIIVGKWTKECTECTYLVHYHFFFFFAEGRGRARFSANNLRKEPSFAMIWRKLATSLLSRLCCDQEGSSHTIGVSVFGVGYVRSARRGRAIETIVPSRLFRLLRGGSDLASFPCHTFFCRSFCWGVACRFSAHLQQFIHYLMKSCKNHGTLGILLQYVNWDACPTPEKDMKACTDALFTVLKGHYVACACKVLRLQVQEQLGGRKEMVTVRCWKFIFEQI